MIFFMIFFLEYFHYHLFQCKRLPKKLSLETFRFFLTFSVYMTIYQGTFRKNDLELEIFTKKGPIFFHQKCFLDHTGILSEKNRKKLSPKRGRDPMDLPGKLFFVNNFRLSIEEKLNRMSLIEH